MKPKYQVGDRVKLLKHQIFGQVIAVGKSYSVGLTKYTVQTEFGDHFFYEYSDIGNFLAPANDSELTVEDWFNIKLEGRRCITSPIK